MRRPGQHGGVIGRPGLRMLRVMLFDDWGDARLQPLETSLDALADATMLSRSTVTMALHRLRERGMVDQQEILREGHRPIYRFIVRPLSQWVPYHRSTVSSGADSQLGAVPVP